MRRALLGLLAVVSLLLGLTAPAHAATGVPLPSSMASTGDSITRGFDATASGCFLSDCPQYSWSTGTDRKVKSQYRSILAANPAISGHVYNDAKTGAKMVDLSGQLSAAASQGVDYVTILMGANDLCTSSAATMTSVSTFTSQFDTALAAYVAARPGSRVFVSSIPNIYQLWSLLHTNFSAQATWSSFGICQSMLSARNTAADRQKVVDQETAFNSALASVCSKYTNCRWDNNATFNTAFTTSDVSTVDYFHPSIAGQNKLAAETWAASYWG
ncbi:GDSL-type esterase/lipase family protein [Intrasporangium oryzae]|nr:GDSL-type esterase/lipase family protein [Intrasporangium oryzae]